MCVSLNGCHSSENCGSKNNGSVVASASCRRRRTGSSQGSRTNVGGNIKMNYQPPHNDYNEGTAFRAVVKKISSFMDSGCRFLSAGIDRLPAWLRKVLENGLLWPCEFHDQLCARETFGTQLCCGIKGNNWIRGI